MDITLVVLFFGFCIAIIALVALGRGEISLAAKSLDSLALFAKSTIEVMRSLSMSNVGLDNSSTQTDFVFVELEQDIDKIDDSA